MDYNKFIQDWRSPDNFIECHTSGSTGKPKTIRLPKEEMIRSARRTIKHFALDRKSHLHSCISPEFIGGKMMAVRSETIGCTLTWETPSNRPLSDYKGESIDLLAVVPSQMDYLLSLQENNLPLPQIQHIIIGGAPISREIHRRIASSGFDAWETYGMTETASHIALRKAGQPDQPFAPLDGIKVTTDQDNRLIIEIKGWQKITTNDIAEVGEDGSFRILGRLDNVIITGGKKVHAEQLEAMLEALLGYDILVSGEPDSKWGERLVMTIEDEGRWTDNDINAICKQNVPAECVPKIIHHGQILRTDNGKKVRKGHK